MLGVAMIVAPMKGVRVTKALDPRASCKARVSLSSAVE